MRKVISFLLCAILCLCVTAFAAMPSILDQSDLLTDQEQSDLNVYFGSIRESEGYFVCAITTDTFEGKSAQTYAEDYYDEYFGGDGVLLLVSLEEGCWYISTNGECAQKIPNARVDAIGEVVIGLVREGEYYEAFYHFGCLVRENMLLYTQGDTTSSGAYGTAIVVCLLIGLVAGGITVGVMAAKMRTVRSQSGAASYVCPGSLQLVSSRDIYLYQTMSRTPRPKSNSSGSGGRSRGGSGGRI